MTSRAKRRSDQLFEQLETISLRAHDADTTDILVVHGQDVLNVPDSTHLPRMKKFRFQLLHQWLIHNFDPCRAADIGGGKGLLAHLLMESGWLATVIDPVPQGLPDKYKDLVLGRRVKIDPAARVPNLPSTFETYHAQYFDLLIGMHAHGSNVKIIDAAAEFGCGFVIFPCCVIDEAFYPPLGVSWLESLADYAVRQGIVLKPFRLNFKGQNIGLYALPRSV
ncbi:MAG TPA: hypothetical protein DEH22_01015 [Chloroflexi bacterium]|nr:hypothetical protein [Chloroflexota bacterium]